MADEIINGLIERQVERAVQDAVANGMRRAVFEERERCAAICDEIGRRNMTGEFWSAMSTAQECAAAIREGK